jgi:translation initiation factor 1
MIFIISLLIGTKLLILKLRFEYRLRLGIKTSKLFFLLSACTIFVITMGKNNGNDWKDRLGVMYSTNPDFNYQTDEEPEQELLPPQQQKLRLRMEKNGRGGKTVTVISGFIGPQADMDALARTLKTFCGCGGSAKDGEIIIQGDFREKLKAKLLSLGYSQTKG